MLARDVFRRQPVLTGERIRLEQLTAAVLEPNWQSLQQHDARRLTGTRAEFSRDQVVEWLASRAEQHDRADWAVNRIADGGYVGEAVINDFDADDESASYRVALAGPHLYGQGYGTEITRLVVDYALDVVRLHRLSLEVYDFNPRAQRCYEKCGFTVEGRARDALLWDGEWHDAILMAIVSGDPRPWHALPR